jgi:hypothetical protein
MLLRWRHCVVNARCSWLRGDKRGFRSRHHKIHSSGDYKRPPPEEEHAGLRAYHEKRSGAGVKFDLDLRIIILTWFIRKLLALDYRVIAASIGEEHLHILVELPWDLDQIREIMGKCKQRASHAVRGRLPGTIWSGGGEFKWVKEKRHFHNIYRYIRTKQEPGTVVWSHRADENWIDHDIPVIVMKRRAR